MAALEYARRAEAPDAGTLAAELGEAAERYLLRFGITLLTILGLLALGSLFFIIAIGSVLQGRLTYHWDGNRLPDWLHLETFTVFLSLMIGLSALRGLIPALESGGLGLSLFFQVLLLGVVAWPRVYRLRWETIRDDVGLGGEGGWIREGAFGAIGYLAGLPLLALGFMATLLILRLTGMELEQGIHPIAPVLQEARTSPIDVLVILVFAVVLAPLIEELMFRGFFYNALRARFAAPGAIILSAALFAGIHPQGWIGLPPLLAVGVMLGVLREWRGSIRACVVAHALNNGLVMLVMLLML
jgi:membrane protease YdiL (CAAX protease family)